MGVGNRGSRGNPLSSASSWMAPQFSEVGLPVRPHPAPLLPGWCLPYLLCWLVNHSAGDFLNSRLWVALIKSSRKERKEREKDPNYPEPLDK